MTTPLFTPAGRTGALNTAARNRQDLWMGVSGGLLVGC